MTMQFLFKKRNKKNINSVISRHSQFFTRHVCSLKSMNYNITITDRKYSDYIFVKHQQNISGNTSENPTKSSINGRNGSGKTCMTTYIKSPCTSTSIKAE